MKRLLAHVPAFLSALLLAAHFSRAGQTAGVVFSLAMAVSVLVPAPAVRLTVRVLLFAGAIEWALTAWTYAAARAESGQPYVRLLVILGIVGLWTLWSAWVLPAPRPNRGDTAASPPLSEEG